MPETASSQTTIDVKAILDNLSLSPSEFAERFEFNSRTVRHWVQGDRQPQGDARALLLRLARREGKVDRVESYSPCWAGGAQYWRLTEAKIQTYLFVYYSGKPFIVCLCCGLNSDNPYDRKELFCANCVIFHAKADNAIFGAWAHNCLLKGNDDFGSKRQTSFHDRYPDW